MNKHYIYCWQFAFSRHLIFSINNFVYKNMWGWYHDNVDFFSKNKLTSRQNMLSLLNVRLLNIQKYYQIIDQNVIVNNVLACSTKDSGLLCCDCEMWLTKTFKYPTNSIIENMDMCLPVMHYVSMKLFVVNKAQGSTRPMRFRFFSE